MKPAPPHLAHDWYPGQISANVAVGKDVYIETSYGFPAFFSRHNPGLVLGDGAGAYGLTTFLVQPSGRVSIGPYSCLKDTLVICSDRISIGAHCLISWGVVLTDSWLDPGSTIPARRAILRAAACDPLCRLPRIPEPRPITVEDNVWVGFNSVILPGVTLGRGCVVGCNSIVDYDVPPYAVVAGNPACVIRRLEPNDCKTVNIAPPASKLA
jgi:acetyltransferase-like isoleucine patch superfamily enzyme